MARRTRIRVDDRRARLYFRGMRIRARDFRRVLEWARREVEDANRDNFATGGRASGARWESLDNEYARWKLEHYGPLPTLIREGALYRDLTFLKGPPNSMTRTEATFGTNHKAARFHQHGTRFMPRRQIVFVPDGLAEGMGERVADYLVHGNEPVAAARRLRGLFRA